MNHNENEEIEEAQKDAEMQLGSQWGKPISLGYIKAGDINREVKCQTRSHHPESIQYRFSSGYILSVAWSKERGNYATHLPGGLILNYEVAVIRPAIGGFKQRDMDFVPLTACDDVAGYRTAQDIQRLIQAMANGARKKELFHYFENH